MIPAALVKQHLYHENSNDEFKSWLDKFVEDGNNVVEEESPQADPAGGSPNPGQKAGSKRKAGPKALEEGSPLKKLKTDPALIKAHRYYRSTSCGGCYQGRDSHAPPC